MQRKLDERVKAYRRNAADLMAKADALEQVLTARAAKTAAERRKEREDLRVHMYCEVGGLLFDRVDCAESGVTLQRVYGLMRDGDDDAARLALITHAWFMAQCRGLHPANGLAESAPPGAGDDAVSGMVVSLRETA